MSEHNQGEPEVFPAERIDILSPSTGQFDQVPPIRLLPKRRLWLPLVLFIATCLSTLMVGVDNASLQVSWAQAVIDGLKYAVPLMTILICHEMGHFLQAWRHGVYCSFPYFIPLPAPPIGT